MKTVVTATVAEISAAIAAEVLKRPELHGKFCASVEVAWKLHDAADTPYTFSIECVFFDTAEGAREYLAPPQPQGKKNDQRAD